jgi:type II secretory pathway component PulF
MKKLENVGLSSAEKIGLVSNLSTMLRAGLPIFEVVTSLNDDAKGNTKIILSTLQEDLTQGRQLYITFSKFPLVFNKVAVNVIRASEEAGTLDQALGDLRKTIQEESEFSDKVKAALMYPLFIVAVFIVVFFIILIVVVPKISLVFSRMQIDLPLPTKIMIFISNLLLNQTIPLIAGFILFVFLSVVMYRKYRTAYANILYSLPLVSNLVHEIDLTRFSRSMYLLLDSGIPITNALELSSDVLMKQQMARLVLASKEMIMAGKKLSEGLRSSKGTVPMLMIKLIEAGERTGSLDKSMQDISEYFDYQVTKTLKTVTALLEPIMLVIVGIVVGAMMIAIITPIYGLIGKVGRG